MQIIEVDKEPMCGHLILANKPDQKPFKFNDKSEEMKGLKANKNISLEEKNIISQHLESQEYEADSNPFSGDRKIEDAVTNIVETNAFVTWDDSTDGREHETHYATTPSESGWREDRKDLYPSASFTDCKMPELVVFPEESNYQVFKDICLDGEVPSQGTCSVENCAVDHNIISCLLNSEADKNINLITEAPNTMPSISNGSQSFFKRDCIKDVVKQGASENLLMEGKVDFGATVEIAGVASAKERPLLVGELVTNYSHSQLSNSIGHRGEQKNNQDPSEEAVLATSMISSATEALRNNSQTFDAAFKNEVENRSINHDCDSSINIAIGREESSENAEYQQTSKTEKNSRLEERISESLALSSFPGHGESSFSAANPPSGPLAYSGQIPYSGSISLRSNSSTTSTQSFAFPILPSEWNGSPLRMVEDDQRHLRKRRGWMGFLCCKF